MASTEIEYKDGTQEKPGMGGRMSNFKKGIWDGENKTFIGRTGSSWAKIGVFYLIYYICLAGFFAISLLIFFTTMDDNQPSMRGYESLIKSNPGLAFRPMPNIESTLIHFNQGRKKTYLKYTDNIQSFLDRYAKTADDSDFLQDCGEGVRPEKDKACVFNPKEQFGDKCIPDNDYGYNEGKPCVLLKMNRVFGWEPKPYNDTDKPVDLKNYTIPAGGGVFVTCEGENYGDIDNLGEVEIFPKEGFKANFFPYTNVKDYQSPIVFVKLSNLKSGVITQVWCKAWAKNIKHHKNDKAGSTHFEVLVD